MTRGDGLPCGQCGTSEWYKDGHCKECHRAYVRRWNHNNPNITKKHMRNWRTKNLEKVRSDAAKWKRNNPVRARKNNRDWYRNNPEKNIAKHKRRRARKAGADGSHTLSEFRSLCEQYDNRCLCCGKKKKLTADHVIPLISGGSDDISNIQPLCFSCNSSKRDRHATDYRTKPGIERWIQERLL